MRRLQDCSGSRWKRRARRRDNPHASARDEELNHRLHRFHRFFGYWGFLDGRGLKALDVKLPLTVCGKLGLRMSLAPASGPAPKGQESLAQDKRLALKGLRTRSAQKVPAPAGLIRLQELTLGNAFLATSGHRGDAPNLFRPFDTQHTVVARPRILDPGHRIICEICAICGSKFRVPNLS